MTPSPRARSRYSAFHGHAPRSVRSIHIRPIRELIYLADADTITYSSNKKNGGGNGKRQYFTHDFGRKVKIFTSKEGDVLLIAGPGLRVTARGIVG